jgi:endonuclease/exonuclease/phosphatase family metal-dependent hydrolase
MRIKFLSLNIWMGNIMDNLIPFIRNENADICVLQEVYNGNNKSWDRKFRGFEVLKQELGYQYSSFAPHVIDKRSFGKVEQGNVIFSNMPITSTYTTFFNAPYGERSEETETDWSTWPCNLQQATIHIKGRDLHVFNTHGPWGLDGKDNEKRLIMSKVIAEQMKEKEFAILAGDFNVQPDTKTIENIERYLVNVFKNELKSTFNMKRKTNPGYATAVVDMVFVTKNISVLDKSCPNVDVSDHLPLVCTLELS